MRQKASSKALIQQRPNQAIVELFKANDQESRSNSMQNLFIKFLFDEVL